MTLLIGSKRGFTFIEVMVALVILSAGIVGVYRSFFLCVDYLNNIATRWWANELIQERVEEVSFQVQQSSGEQLDVGPVTEVVSVNHRPIAYQFNVTLTPSGSLQGLFKLDVALSWTDGHRPMRMNRSVYILQ